MAVIGLIATSLSLRQVQQYQRGVVLRLGRLLPEVRQPGLALMVPIIDRMTKVSIQTVVLNVPSQGAITRDNVTVGVDAVVYFRVVDPVKAVINVENYLVATSQVSQTSLRSVIGRADLDTVLSDRDHINNELKGVIDAPTEEWGIHIDRVEVKDISLPEGMRRSMSRQAEAERERRARVIGADGEFQASTKLAQAAAAMEATPGALQLRLLQTVVEVAAEKNSTLVMPFPVELLRFFEAAAGAASQSTQDAPRCKPSESNGSRAYRAAGYAPARLPQAPRQIANKRRQLGHRARLARLGHPLLELVGGQPARSERPGQSLDHRLAVGVRGPDVLRHGSNVSPAPPATACALDELAVPSAARLSTAGCWWPAGPLAKTRSMFLVTAPVKRWQSVPLEPPMAWIHQLVPVDSTPAPLGVV